MLHLVTREELFFSTLDRFNMLDIPPRGGREGEKENETASAFLSIATAVVAAAFLFSLLLYLT